MTEITPLTPAQVQADEAQASKESYPVRALIGVDEAVNVLAGGKPDETISSRSARAAERGALWGKVMSGFLNIFQRNHGVKAQAGDIERGETVAKIETDTLPVTSPDSK